MRPQVGMAPGTLANETPARPRLSLALLRDAWRGITRDQIVVTFLLGCALSLYRIVVTIDVRYAQFIFVGDQMKAFALLLAIAVADRLTGRDPERRGTYAAAVAVGSAIVVPLVYFTVWSLIKIFVGSTLQPPGRVGFVLNVYLELVMVGGAAVWMINDRRRAARARTRMHVVALQRIAAEQASVESELQAMQARVEPRFLFDTLAQVKQLYASAPATGERLLDALIAYLRAAVPKSAGTASMVGSELDLVRGYLAIARLRLNDRLVFEVEPVSLRVARMRMPAMLLLPLVDHAIAPELAEGDARLSMHVTVEAADGMLRFRARKRAGRQGASEASMPELQSRLAALYGSEGRVSIERIDAERTDFVLAFPQRAQLRSRMEREMQAGHAPDGMPKRRA